MREFSEFIFEISAFTLIFSASSSSSLLTSLLNFDPSFLHLGGSAVKV